MAYLRARGDFQGASQEVQDLLRHSNGGVDQPQVYDRPRPDGRILEVQTVPIKGGGALRTFTDVTQRKQAEQQIRHVAEHDGLTGLLNRTAFLQALQAAATDVHRSGRGFAVLYVDLDGFKPVNDRYGHAVGDQLLVWVARQLTQAAREDDVVARLGGDEFALLQRGVSDGDSAYAWPTAWFKPWAGPPRSKRMRYKLARPSALSCRPATAPRPKNSCARPIPRCTWPRPRGGAAQGFTEHKCRQLGY